MPDKNLILIVDDEEGNCEVLEALLTPLGHRLQFAANGQEALQQAVASRPDLIVLDVMMPGMDGFEVCRRLRATAGLQEVPIVLITALDDRASRLQGFEAGADEYVTKPFDRTELRARVLNTLRLNRFRRLESERERFARIAEFASDGLLLLNAEDDVVYANPAARVLLGMATNESGDRENFLDLIQRHYQLQPAELWSEWPASAEPTPGKTLYLLRPESRTGSALWLQVELVSKAQPGLAERLFRLRDATREIGEHREWWQFHKSLSHKLRTPLVALVSSLDLLVDDETLSAEEMRELATMARQGIQRLERQVTDVLKFVQSPLLGRQAGIFALKDLVSLTERVRMNLKIPAVTVTIAPELRAEALQIAPAAMETILVELLENALKFHPRRSPTVEISAQRRGNGVAVRIMDDGVSVPPEALANVWMPYYQNEKRFTGEVEGMGLGLSMVRSITWECGGHCEMINRPNGSGVIVELKLPLAAK